MMITLMSSALAWEIQTTESGDAFHWAQMPLDYTYVDGNAPGLNGVHDAVDEAFAAWASVPGSFVEVDALRASDEVGQIALDEDQVVYFEPDWPVGDEALAVATTWADEHGNMLSFDIRINTSVPWSTTGEGDAFDLQAAIAHEVGHVLGLQHSDETDATMYAAHDHGDDWRRELHADDEAAVQFLYGDGPFPEASPLGLGCATSPLRGPTLALLLLAPFARRRR